MPRVNIRGKIISFPDTMSNDEINTAIASIGAGPDFHPLGSNIPQDTALRPGPGPIARALNLLPTAGGVVGSMVGGAAGAPAGGVGAVPGALAGAGMGGAGGEAMQQLAQHALTAVAPQFAAEQGIEAPQSSGSAARDIGLAAAEQAVYEAMGHGTAALGGVAGKTLMQGALRSGADVASVALKERVAATLGGLAATLRKSRESSAMLHTMLNRANTTGMRFHAPDLADEIGRRLIPKVESSPTRGDDWRAVSGYARRFIEDFGRRPLDFVELQRLKQRADAISAPIWKKIDAGEVIEGPVKARGMWFKEMADHLRDLLERTVPPRLDAGTGKLVSVAEQNAETQQFIKLAERTRKAVRPGRSFGAKIAQRGAGMAAGATVGATIGATSGGTPGERVARGAAGAVAGGVAVSPEVLSMTALAMTHPMLAALLAQGSRAAGAMVRQAGE